jgi:hypothetical protein
MREKESDRFVVTNPFAALKFNIVYGPKLTDLLSRFLNAVGKPSV